MLPELSGVMKKLHIFFQDDVNIQVFWINVQDKVLLLEIEIPLCMQGFVLVVYDFLSVLGVFWFCRSRVECSSQVTSSKYLWSTSELEDFIFLIAVK